MGKYSLEHCPIILDALNKRRNVSVLYCVPKNDAAITKNLHVITRQDTKIGGYQVEQIQRDQEDYPNPWKHKKIFNSASKMFTQLAS